MEDKNFLERLADRVRTEVPMASLLLRKTGEDPQDRAKFHSPVNNGKAGTFSVFRHPKGCWLGKDHGNDWVGDNIRLVMDMDKIPYKEAVLNIARMFEMISEEEYQKEMKKPYRGEVKKFTEIPEVKTAPLRSPEFINYVYSLFAQGMHLVDEHRPVLSEEHRLYLHNRGIQDSEISYMGYFTMPDRSILGALRIALEARGYSMKDLIGVPGFYKWLETDKVDMVAPEGIGIPLKNADGLITAIQIRADVVQEGYPRYSVFSSTFVTRANCCKVLGGGCGPARMISVVKPELMKFPDRVLVTEGMFKAAQWTAWKHSWAISVQGVNNIKGIGTELAHIEKQTGKIKEVLIGFDADLIDNKHVFDAEVKLRKLLEKHGYKVEYLCWNEKYGKGIDDVIIAGNQKHFRHLEPAEFETRVSRKAAWSKKEESK